MLASSEVNIKLKARKIITHVATRAKTVNTFVLVIAPLFVSSGEKSNLQNLTSDNETKNGALTECVKSVCLQRNQQCSQGTKDMLQTGRLPFSSPRSTVTRPRVTGSSSSGKRILLIAIEAGILMTEDVTKFCGGTPRPIYAVNTEPAIVENPDVIVKSRSCFSGCAEYE